MFKKNYLYGTFIIALGVILALNALGVTSINIFFTGWWTLIIIIPSFVELLTENRKKESLRNMLIGVVLLLLVKEVIKFELFLNLIIPIIVIYIGFKYIYQEKNSKNKE